VLLQGQLLNGARDIYWQVFALNRDITSSGRKNVEKESEGVTGFQTGRIDAATVGNLLSS
jgi:hypothetical protein